MYASANDFASLMSLFFRDDVPYGSSVDQILDGTTIRQADVARYSHRSCDVLLIDRFFSREWLQPAFWNNNGKTGFGMPWEMYYFDDELLYTKVTNPLH